MVVKGKIESELSKIEPETATAIRQILGMKEAEKKGNGLSEYVFKPSLKVSSNQYCFSWGLIVGKKRLTVSSKRKSELTPGQIQFIQKNKKTDAKILVKRVKGGQAIVELWLKDIDTNEYVPLDDDILEYKGGKSIRHSHGFNGFTFLPATTVSAEETDIEEPIMYNNTVNAGNIKAVPQGAFSELAALVEDIEQEAELLADPPEPEKSGLTKEDKVANATSFVKNMDVELYEIFKPIPNCDVNIDNTGYIRFSMEIEGNSKQSIWHQKIVGQRNHAGTKLDAIDGEAIFVELMNPIFEHLGFDFRFVLDGRAFIGMGDNGDFKYGTRRIDIKTRRKSIITLRNGSSAQAKANLLVNSNTVGKGFNEYGLVHREGDYDREGKQRRCTFVGTATHEKVTKHPAQMINKKLKHEVSAFDLDSLRRLISRVVLEVLQKEE